MKQPRTSDFDPSAKEHALKSSLEDFPAIAQPQQPLLAERLLETRPYAQEARSVAPGRRRIKPRHGFDVYEDQVEELKRLAIEDRMRGGAGSMSAMVREALDDFISKVKQVRGV